MQPQVRPQQVNFNTMLYLMKNPERAATLQPEKDFVNGLLGLVASLLGFMIWGWALNKKIFDIIGSVFGGFGGYDDYYDLFEPSSAVSSAVMGRVFVLGLVSILVLTASVWLIGQWRGSRKLTAKEVVTYIGGMQYTFGAGFVVAALCTLINLRLATLVLLVNLIAALTTTVISSSDIFRVSRERRFSFITLSIAVYFLLFMLVTAIVI
ncbi:hypothetical protein [Paenibacillus spiritus]|nr:hypothetical protein [Paenibacillus spiritus]